MPHVPAAHDAGPRGGEIELAAMSLRDGLGRAHAEHGQQTDQDDDGHDGAEQVDHRGVSHLTIFSLQGYTAREAA